MHALILAFVLSAEPVSLHLAWEGGDPSLPHGSLLHDAASLDSGIVSDAPVVPVPESSGVCLCGGDPRKSSCTCRVGCNCEGYVAADTRPALKIISPATWECVYCPRYMGQDWSQFNATKERRDGLPSYPCAEWTDKRGVTRRLYGAYTPSQVKWSMDQTNQ